MPHTKSAKKSLRQDQKRRDRNRAVKKGLKAEIKKFLTGNGHASKEQMQGAVQSRLRLTQRGKLFSNEVFSVFV